MIYLQPIALFKYYGLSMKKILLILIAFFCTFLLSSQTIFASTVLVNCEYDIHSLTLGKFYEPTPTVLNKASCETQAHVKAVVGQEVAMRFFPTNGIPDGSTVQVWVDNAWRNGAIINGGEGGTTFYTFQNTNDYTWRGRYKNGNVTYECKDSSLLKLKLFKFEEVVVNETIISTNGNPTTIRIESPIGGEIGDYVWHSDAQSKHVPAECEETKARFSFNNKIYTLPNVEWDRLYSCDTYNQFIFTLTSPNCVGSRAEFTLSKIKFYARRAEEVQLITPPPPPPLSCPEITKITCGSDGGVKIYWSDVGADLYYVQRNGTTIVKGGWLSFADTTAPCGVEHTYNINVSLSSGDVITCQQERNHKITCPCTSTPTTSPTAGPTSAPTAGPSPVISGSWHDYNPTETFIYRPDFLVNTPDEMKDFVFEWRELPPEKL